MSVKSVGTRTSLRRLHQSGSMKCLFPRRHDPSIEAVLINTAGGITGGDDFSLTATAEPDTKLTLTTQTAERAYRAAPAERGHLRTRLHVAPRAHLNWLPQETILFNGSSFERSLVLDIEPDASALVVEPIVFGRVTMGEVLSNVDFRDRIEIRRAGQPLYLDAIQFLGDMQTHLENPNIAAGARAMASIVLIAPDAEAKLAQLRPMLPLNGGASLLGDDLLVARILAQDSYELRKNLVPILNALTENNLPRCWMI